MAKKIRVTIDQLGQSTVEAEGFSGQSCQSATSAIESALGGAAHVEHKPEYYQSGEEVETVASW